MPAGLEVVDEGPGHLHLRAAGSHHHAFELAASEHWKWLP
jgi:hypothetical protein